MNTFLKSAKRHISIGSNGPLRYCHNHGHSVKLQDYHVIGLQKSCLEMAKEVKLLRQEIVYLKKVIVSDRGLDVESRINVGRRIENALDTSNRTC